MLVLKKRNNVFTLKYVITENLDGEPIFSKTSYHRYSETLARYMVLPKNVHLTHSCQCVVQCPLFAVLLGQTLFFAPRYPLSPLPDNPPPSLSYSQSLLRRRHHEHDCRDRACSTVSYAAIGSFEKDHVHKTVFVSFSPFPLPIGCKLLHPSLL